MTAALSEGRPVDGWTVDDLSALPDDGVRRELIDGALHVSPSPTSIHQVIACTRVVLDQTCPENLFVSQSNDVELSARRLFIPDVLVTTFEAARRRTGSFAGGGGGAGGGDRVAGLAERGPGAQAGALREGRHPLLLADRDRRRHHRAHVPARRGPGVYEPSGTFTDMIRTDGRGRSRSRSPGCVLAI